MKTDCLKALIHSVVIRTCPVKRPEGTVFALVVINRLEFIKTEHVLKVHGDHTCWILEIIWPAKPALTACGFTRHRVVLTPRSHFPTPA